MKTTAYIISSFRNIGQVTMLQNALRREGHTVLDWTVLPHKAVFDSSYEEYAATMKSEESINIFGFCTAACIRADVVIYLGPAGQDSAAQLNLASISGTPVIGVINRKERLGIMVYNMIGLWVEDIEEVVGILSACNDKSTLLWKCRVCGCTWGRACSPACWWVEENLCSSCVGREGKNV